MAHVIQFSQISFLNLYSTKLLLLKVELDFLIILLICSSYFVLNMSSVGTVLILKIPDSKFLDFSRLS